MAAPLFSLSCPCCGEVADFDAVSIRWQASVGEPAWVAIEALTDHRHP